MTFAPCSCASFGVEAMEVHQNSGDQQGLAPRATSGVLSRGVGKSGVESVSVAHAEAAVDRDDGPEMWAASSDARKSTAAATIPRVANRPAGMGCLAAFCWSSATPPSYRSR